MAVFDKVIEINNLVLTKKYIQSLNREERLELVDPIFNYFRETGFPIPDDYNKINKEYKRLLDYKCNLDDKVLFNNSSVATSICRFFCKSFYAVTEEGKPTMLEVFNNDGQLKSLIKNRLGLEWYDEVNEAFNFSPKMLIQGFRSKRLVIATSLFKPVIAKHIYEKYSQVGDLCYDYSAGFGGRMLGAAASGRKYVGVDPLTSNELKEMRDYLKLENCEVYDDVSEEFCIGEETIDFAFSSPPYYNQEYYSADLKQCYNKGEEYFYGVYWKNTLNNIYKMLKTGKFFALNVKNTPQMVEMAQEKFGNVIDELYLRTIRNHLNKKAGIEKTESVYLFKK